MDFSKEPHLIGLSLSRCVRDVILEKVSVEQIDRIIARTKCETPEDWNQVIESYKIMYWREDPEKAERITRNLLALNKIEQPRVSQGMRPGELLFQEGYGGGYHWCVPNTIKGENK